MVLADRHPYPAHFLFGDVKAMTAAGMENREHAVENISDQSKAIFRELKIEFEAGRLDPLRREWCTDCDAEDFTRSTFGLDQVLMVIQRRGDTGWLIGKLLAIGPAKPSQSEPDLTGDGGAASQEAKPKASRRRKLDPTIDAITALKDAPDWETLRVDDRMTRIEQHLKKPTGWCSRSTYNRAMDECSSHA
jgi:hypothetical protein